MFLCSFRGNPLLTYSLKIKESSRIIETVINKLNDEIKEFIVKSIHMFASRFFFAEEQEEISMKICGSCNQGNNLQNENVKKDSVYGQPGHFRRKHRQLLTKNNKMK